MGLEPMPSPPRAASCIRPEAGGVVFWGSEPPVGDGGEGMWGLKIGGVLAPTELAQLSPFPPVN